ncbi:hypothetical protein [Glaciihabitans sp. dw_435]|uniref:hypothetical protein n=1 Tax=Glaciihabitans sp. dw_435 TaxID=2720081 RepID=UPI001BD57A80|nr:hypothetical protein [Glaciihabitans sp. dw_435]
MTVLSRSRVILLVFVAATTVGLAGCSSTSASTTPDASASVTQPSASHPSTTTATDTPSASTSTSNPGTTTTASSGCAPTPATSMPADAVARKVIDVDGDGKKDVLWATDDGGPVRFGVTTASGAMFSYEVNSASPGGRHAFLAKMVGGRIISLADDGRGAYLHVLVGCNFVQPLNPGGEAYTFDMENLRGNGTGVGCITTDQGTEIVGLQATATGRTYTVTQTVINLSANGKLASNGATTTLGTKLAATDPIVVGAQSITCGASSAATDGVSIQEQ